jgi:hypothetical protein
MSIFEKQHKNPRCPGHHMAAYGIRYGRWQMTNGRRPMTDGKWKMENGKWEMENSIFPYKDPSSS